MRWAAIATVMMACGGGGGPVSVFGPPTESTCPPASTVTYESFGRDFMERYCTRCHASTLEGAARQGAPSFHDFDTVFGVRGVADHVDETTAAGPAAVNEGMPPDGPRPTLDERLTLGEWIACGTP
jgi:hypothetical protein